MYCQEFAAEQMVRCVLSKAKAASCQEFTTEQIIANLLHTYVLFEAVFVRSVLLSKCRQATDVLLKASSVRSVLLSKPYQTY